MSVHHQDYEESYLYRIRHSAAHIMAQAVLEMFPDAKIAIGPPIEDGFYYDFDLPRPLTPEDLDEIEERMRRIIREHYDFKRQVISAQEARQVFKDQPYKLELIDGLEHGNIDEHGNPVDTPPEITTYTHDGFVDLCRGPHVENTGKLNPKAVKLLSVAGAYWHGDENQPMLQRIYGTAWENPAQLKEYLNQLEEARKRDHRKLGRELDLFFFDDEVGPGLPLWTPRGTAIIEEIEKLAHEMERKRSYQFVRTPHLTKEQLFYRSGHLPYYADSMYPPMEAEGVRYYVKPMNCPFHHKIFASQPRSYRDLPLRLAEYGTCYRYEKSGQLFGLLRVRSMQMNDAHIYVAVEDFEEEFMGVIDLYMEYFRIFSIEKYVMQLSTYDPSGLGKKYVNNEKLWIQTEDMVRRVMQDNHVPFVEVKNEAAFYGPKIDVEIWSATGKEYTLATNQVDFAVPERFELNFTNKEGQPETPLCLHRAPLSTHERLIGFLIEHYAGAFPPWLAPEQVRVIPITDSQNAYADQVAQRLFDSGLRSQADNSTDRMNAKIRKAQLLKIPYMIILGDKEMKSDTISLRKRDGSQAQQILLEEFINDLKATIRFRSERC
jgi:threonyl-tRNA synthetase